MDRAEIVSGLKDLIERQTRISIGDEDQQLDIDSFTTGDLVEDPQVANFVNLSRTAFCHLFLLFP